MTTVTLAGPKNKFRLAEGVNLKGLWRLHAMMGGFFWSPPSAKRGLAAYSLYCQRRWLRSNIVRNTKGVHIQGLTKHKQRPVNRFKYMKAN